MSLRDRRWAWLGGVGGLAVVAGLLVAGLTAARGADAADGADDPAVERARHQVQMLDSLYKTAVVSITERYPRGQPAINVAMDIFGAMRNGEHHSARLVDVTGLPLGVDNTPRTDFEEKAAKAMRQGETYVDQVVGDGDERRLLAATVVPAVHKRCAECHGVEQGDLLGFISYEVPFR